MPISNNTPTVINEPFLYFHHTNYLKITTNITYYFRKLKKHYFNLLVRNLSFPDFPIMRKVYKALPKTLSSEKAQRTTKEHDIILRTKLFIYCKK